MANSAPKFLRLAVQSGKLTEEQRIKILDAQKKLPSGKKIAVGQLSETLGFLDIKDREELLREQANLRSEIPQKASQQYSFIVINRNPIIAVLAIVMVGVLVMLRKWQVNDATQLVGFTAGLLSWLLEYRLSRNFYRAITQFFLIFGVVIVVCVIVYARWALNQLSDLVSTHPDAINVGIPSWVFQIKFAIVSLSTISGIIFLYASWKYHSLKAAESRLSVFKDILMKVHLILEKEKGSIAVRQILAINFVLTKLHYLMGMNTSDVLMRRLMVTSVRPGANAVGVLFFVPDEENHQFKILSAAFPDKVDKEVKDAFVWIKENHQPVFLNEELFERRKRQAQGRNSKGWERTFLNFADRRTYVSVVGWTYEKQEEFSSKSASKCLAFDDSFFDEVAGRFDKRVLNWIQVKAFLAKRVYKVGGKRAGVLLVTKNAGNGFSAEDDQLMKIAAEIIGLVLRFEGTTFQAISAGERNDAHDHGGN